MTHKNYEYFIALADHLRFGCYKRKTVTLNHPMTATDLEAIEKMDHTCVVVNFRLLKVTGTFTYRVFYEIRESLCSPIYTSRSYTIDHKVTTSSYDEDMKSFIDQMRANLTDRQYPHIISFQEIPSE